MDSESERLVVSGLYVVPTEEAGDGARRTGVA